MCVMCRPFLIHSVCLTVVLAVIYSASHVESATILCLDEVQCMGVLLKVYTIPE